MNGNGERWSSFCGRNEALRSRLLTWELLLFQLTDDRYRSDRRLFAMLQPVTRLLEQDLSDGFAQEEGWVYADTQDLPALRDLVRQLRAEHDALRKHFEDISRRLDDGTLLENAELIRASGAALTQAIRDHMRRDEQELIPLVEMRYRPAASTGHGRVA